MVSNLQPGLEQVKHYKTISSYTCPLQVAATDRVVLYSWYYYVLILPAVHKLGLSVTSIQFVQSVGAVKSRAKKINVIQTRKIELCYKLNCKLQLFESVLS